MQKIKSAKELELYLNTEFTKLRSLKQTIPANSKYFQEIGSTTCEDIAYADQIKIKKAALKLIFAGLIDDIEIQVEKSPKEYEYRLKMEFTCAYNPIYEPHSRFGQKKKGNFSWVIDMDECNLVDKEWFSKTRKVYEFLQKLGLRNYDLKKQDGDLKYIVLRAFGDQGMLTLITKSLKDKNLIKQASDYAIELGFRSVYWLKNDSISDVAIGEVVEIFGENSILIPLKLGQKGYMFNVTSFTFFQNNIYCFEEILKYIEAYLSKGNYKDTIILDLYCGVGTIGICLAKHFKNLIGLELIEDSIVLAKANAALNNIPNTIFEVIDLYKDFSEKYKNLEKKVAIVDPPRTGLEAKGTQEILNINPDKIIYISCNPITQAQDLERLKTAYRVVQARGFDMFPQTNHVENILILERLGS